MSKQHIQIETTINTGLIPDIANIIAGYAEVKKFEVGQTTNRFTITRKSPKSLFIIYTGCNVIQRTKLFYNEFGGEYAKYNKEVIYP